MTKVHAAINLGHVDVINPLHAIPRWIAWKYVGNSDPSKKPRKVPSNLAGRNIDAHDPKHWHTFEKASAGVQRHSNLQGVGFVFNGDGICGIDLDNCINRDGVLDEWAQPIIAAADGAYVERTPSGRGLHIIGRSSVAKSTTQKFEKKDPASPGVEFYASGRYFTFTGAGDGNPLAGIDVAVALVQQQAAQWQGETKKSNLNGKDRSASAFTHPQPWTDTGMNQARDALAKIPPDIERPYWINVGQAIYDGTHGSQTGLDLWDEWSRGDLHGINVGVYEDNCATNWNSMNPPGELKAAGKDPITTGYLFWLAKEHGGGSEKPSPGQDLENLNERVMRHYRRGLPENIYVDDIPDHPYVVEGMFPVEVSITGGPSGISKSTVTLWEMACIATGQAIYGNEVLRPGAVLYISGEDDERTVLRRLQRMTRHWSAEQRRTLRENFDILDLSTEMVSFIVHNPDTRQFYEAPLAQTIIDLARERRYTLITIDPTSNFQQYEDMSLNDSWRAFIQVLRRVYQETGAAMHAVHHVSQEAARSKMIHETALRGGTQLSNGARFIRLIYGASANDSTIPRPAEVPLEAVANHRVARLHIVKNTHGPLEDAPLWAVRSYGIEGMRIEGFGRVSVDDSQQYERTIKAHSGLRLSMLVGVLPAFVEAFSVSKEMMRTTAWLREELGMVAGLPHAPASREVVEAVNQALATGGLRQQGRVLTNPDVDRSDRGKAERETREKVRAWLQGQYGGKDVAVTHAVAAAVQEFEVAPGVVRLAAGLAKATLEKGHWTFPKQIPNDDAAPVRAHKAAKKKRKF